MFRKVWGSLEGGSLKGRFLCINDRATMMGRKSGTEEREKIELNIKTKLN